MALVPPLHCFRRCVVVSSAAALCRMLLLLLATSAVLMAVSASSASSASSSASSNNNDRSLIVDADANVVSAAEFPYYVRSANPIAALCGGALIHPDVFLTAAHCHGAFRYGVHIGYVKDGQEEETIIKRSAVEFKRHAEYNRNKKIISHDIMVIRLNEPVYNVTSYAKLNANPAIPADFQRVTFCGSGKVEHTGQHSIVLQRADLFVVPQRTCATALGLGSNVAIRDDVLCAGFPVDLQAPCKGDSGGPLVIKGEDTSSAAADDDLLIGLVSFGQLCGTINPNGFARISTFYDWIRHQVCEISQVPPADSTDCPVLAVEPPPTEGMHVTVTILYGDNPEETTYSIRNAATFDIVHTGPEYNPEVPYQSYTSRQIALPPGEYWLELYDENKNGLTGFFRNGYYEVRGTYIMNGNNNGNEQEPEEEIVLVARHDEKFTDYDRAVFNVTAGPLPASSAVAGATSGDATGADEMTATTTNNNNNKDNEQQVEEEKEDGGKGEEERTTDNAPPPTPTSAAATANIASLFPIGSSTNSHRYVWMAVAALLLLSS